MIVAGTGPLIHIDPGKGEPGMVLQRREGSEWVEAVYGTEHLSKLYCINKKHVMVNS